MRDGTELTLALSGTAPEIVLGDGIYVSGLQRPLVENGSPGQLIPDWMWRNSFVIGRSVVVRALNPGKATLMGPGICDPDYYPNTCDLVRRRSLNEHRSLGHAPKYDEYMRVVYIDATHGENIVLEGLVIMNGNLESDDGGAGIRISGSRAHVTLNDCVIRNNHASLTSSGLGGAGGGLLIESFARVTLNRVDIHNNRAYGTAGGGVMVYSGNVTLNWCNIFHNMVTKNAYSTGAGLYFAVRDVNDLYEDWAIERYDGVPPTNVIMRHCHVFDNRGGGNSVVGGNNRGNGNGIQVERGVNLIMEYCHIHSHAPPTNPQILDDWRGAGMHFKGKSLTMSGCNFTKNRSFQDGGGLFIEGELTSTATITNCVFDQNQANNQVRLHELHTAIISYRRISP